MVSALGGFGFMLGVMVWNMTKGLKRNTEDAISKLLSLFPDSEIEEEEEIVSEQPLRVGRETAGRTVVRDNTQPPGPGAFTGSTLEPETFGASLKAPGNTKRLP